MPEKGFKMHRSLHIYIERTYGKTQSVVLDGNQRHHHLFVRQVALMFRRTAGAFAFLAAVGFLALLLKLGSPKLDATYLTYCINNYMYLV